MTIYDAKFLMTLPCLFFVGAQVKYGIDEYPGPLFWFFMAGALTWLIHWIRFLLMQQEG